MILIHVGIVTIIVLLIGSILWAIAMLIGQKKILSEFDPSPYVRQLLVRYQKMGSLNPGFVEDDMRQDIEHVLDPDVSMINLIISSLSVLGLLGTFIGLSGALGVLHGVLVDGRNVSELTSQVAFAFGTSVLGLIAALGLNVFQKFNQRHLDELFLEAKNDLFDVLYKEGAEHTLDLKDLAFSIRSTFQEEIKNFANIQHVSLEQLKEWASELIQHNTDKIFQMVQSNEDRLEKVIEKLNAERKSIDSVKQNWNNAIDQLHKSSVNIKSMTQNLNNFAALSEKLIDRIGEFAEAYQTQIAMINHLHKEQSKPSDIMNELSKIMMENLNQNKKMYDLNSANQVMLEKMVEKIVHDVEGLLQGMKEVFDGVHESFDSLQEKIESSTVEGHKQLQSLLKETNDQMLGNFAREVGKIEKILLSANKEISQVVKDATVKFEHGLPSQEQQLIALNKGFNQLDAKLKRAFEAIINRGIRTWRD